jgi:mannose-1-phosphate guanylyltransferase/mannose-6-phosphate isomerase
MTDLISIVPVLLSGGFGTRLWPASRRRQPKQLLPLLEEHTMFRATLDRAGRLSGSAEPIVVCNADHLVGIQQELLAADHGETTIVLEPAGRNTAPAVAAAALELTQQGDCLLLVLPADHVIRNEDAFIEAVATAAEVAAEGRLLTFGIAPTHPETGFGYIQFGDPIENGVREVAAFREKPDRRTAEEYLASGRYLWNSGMFLFAASRFLEELDEHRPEIVSAVRQAHAAATRDDHVIALERTAFEACPSDSIDYAVMENTDRAAVLPLHAGWNDVGSWSSLWDLGEHDEDGNVFIGDVESVDVAKSYVRSGSRLVGLVGVDDVVVVETPDAVLVAGRDRAQDVKLLVEQLQKKMRAEFDSDGTEARPWGRFRTLAMRPGYRILHLAVVPGGMTSMQVHEHLSEHWMVVRGVARVHVGDTTTLLSEGESVFIPAGETHRLENPQDDELEVIEIDIGLAPGLEGTERRE